MKRIKNLSSTFDLIHSQHIKIAKVAYKKLKLDQVWIFSTKCNFLKVNVSTTNEQRIVIIKEF